MNTPILFLIFNRFDTAQRVFNEIKMAKPKQLFIAADGPRDHVQGEKEKCEQTRSIIHQIDWSCEVKTLFRERNLGCGKGVSSAINWFFEQVEEGIILEDDCVPDRSFFPYCEKMLKKYQDDQRVTMITGTSYLFNKERRKESYFFSKYYPVWGWATWRRAWKLYDIQITKWGSQEVNNKLHEFFKNNYMEHTWNGYFDLIKDKKLDTWDVQWCYTCIMNNGLCVTPVYNLISNIGYHGAHAQGDKTIFHEMPVISFNIDNVIHPKSITCDRVLNYKVYQNIKSIPNFPYVRNVLRRPYRFLKKLFGR